MPFAMSENLDSQVFVTDLLREAGKLSCKELPSSGVLPSASPTRDLKSFVERTVALNTSVLSIVPTLNHR